MKSFYVMWVCLTAAIATAGADHSAPLDVVAGNNGKVYVNESAAGRIAVIDAESLEIVQRIAVGEACNGFAVSPDNEYLYAVAGGPEGRLLQLDAASGEVKRTVEVGHTPDAVVISPDGKRVFVCNRFSNDVSVIDAATMQEKGRVVVVREPVAAAISQDGRFVFVANMLPAGAADQAYVAACVSVIDAKKMQICRQIALPNGSSDLRDICISPDGKFAYVTHILARYQLPTTQLQRGWMNTNALSVIDVAQRKLFNTVLLDGVDAGAANPWGVACSSDGEFLCVSHAGTAEISVIDRPALHERLERAASGMRVTEVTSRADQVKNDMSFLRGIRRRINTGGAGPRSLAVSGARVFAAEFFSDRVAVFDLPVKTGTAVKHTRLMDATKMSTVRKGQMYFNDASLCFQGWQSCASCHPGEARMDVFNWDLLNDGIGNPKNTKSLLASHYTGTAMITGIRASAEVAVRAGIEHIQFAQVDEEKADAIDTYLKSLQPVPSPRLINGKLSESARRGRKLFEEAACSHCHTGEYFTDMQKHDIWADLEGSPGPLETPTLVEIWRTAPYLFDGRAATMEQVLVEHNKNGSHGRTSGLSDQQIQDLAQYVLSL